MVQLLGMSVSRLSKTRDMGERGSRINGSAIGHECVKTLKDKGHGGKGVRNKWSGILLDSIKKPHF